MHAKSIKNIIQTTSGFIGLIKRYEKSKDFNLSEFKLLLGKQFTQEDILDALRKHIERLVNISVKGRLSRLEIIQSI